MFCWAIRTSRRLDKEIDYDIFEDILENSEYISGIRERLKRLERINDTKKNEIRKVPINYGNKKGFGYLSNKDDS